MATFGFRRPLATLLMALATALALVVPVQPASAAPVDPVGAAASVEPAVARIDTEIHYQHAIGAGAGIVLDPGGQVLTNFHVVSGPTGSPRRLQGARTRPNWSATTVDTTSRCSNSPALAGCPRRPSGTPLN